MTINCLYNKNSDSWNKAQNTVEERRKLTSIRIRRAAWRHDREPVANAVRLRQMPALAPQFSFSCSFKHTSPLIEGNVDSEVLNA